MSVAAANLMAMEGGPSGTFTVTRVGGDSAELTVLYSVGGTATQGSDYDPLGVSVTILAGQASAAIQVDPINDGEIEIDETVVVTLTADPAYNIGTPAEATVTVVSDDETPPTVSFTVSTATAMEAGATSGVLTVTRDGDPSAVLTIFYSVAGTAAPVDDYAALSGSVSFAQGQTDAMIYVMPIDDNDLESDETVVVTFTADSAYNIGAPAEATVTIVSDETKPTVNVTASDPTATESPLSSGAFTVTRVGDDSAELTVLYSVGGTATQDIDYVALGASVTIAASETSATIQVDPITDALVEVNETVVVTLLPDPAYDIATLAAATVTILIPIVIVNDIEPRSDSNTINLNKKKGRKSKISVAILSTEGFDATTVGASTVRFGPDGADGAFPARKARIKDIDRDGDRDIILQFHTSEIGFGSLDEVACLIGLTTEGASFVGCNPIEVVRGN